MKWLRISVVYLLVFVIKCMGMSVSELEDFSNFLKRTSQLDETLKKGTNPDDVFDEDEPASDHAWEESGKFEGDLILNERQRRLIVEDVAEGLSRNGLKDSTKRWPNNVVIYYIQREHFTGDQVQAIEDGIDDLSRASCVKFKPYKKGDRDAVVIQGSRRGCFSQVGYQGGYQVLNLSGRHPVGRGCFRHGTVVHELLHTLGFYHMQSSPDRDDYISVQWENIIEPARHNFRKYNSFAVSDFGVGYDYESVLHYSRRAFSKNGRDTLVPKMSGASIGQRIGLSDKDTQKLNKMYCDADSNNFEGSEEETTQKATVEKKASKNKPFEGQGIGYHQGKTVVIKLPAAETYKLPDSPTIHVFDYFSKTPQAVSPSLAEGFGTGKKIGYSYKLPEINSEGYKKTPTLYTNTHENSYDELKLHNTYGKDDQNKVTESTESPIKENKYEIDQSYEIPKHFSQDAENWRGNSVKADDDFNEAFARLGKIIKTHVYPSQTPNLNVYTMNTDYSDFYKPVKKFESEPEIAKEDEAFRTSLPAKMKEDETYYTKELNTKTSQKFIQSPNTSSQNKDHDHRTADNIEKFKSPEDDEETIEEIDSSYGTSYPLRQMYKVKEENIVDPEFAKLENLVYKHNLSSLYSQNKDENNNDKSLEEKHKVFSHVVPQGGGMYGKYNLEGIPEKYTLYKYTYPSSDEHSSYYSEPSEKLKNYSGTDKEFDSTPSVKKAYSLHPITQDWYKKVDYDPHNRSYLIEESESKENKR